jgi:hypothetical protein
VDLVGVAEGETVMLTIQMPDRHGKKEQRRRRRALAYLVPFPLVIIAALRAPTFLLIPLVGFEAWWLWAVCTDPGIRR